jgi:nucleoside-diphosphate-sugar epimerase
LRSNAKIAVTVLGAGGFIGRHVVDRLSALGVDCHAPARNADLRGEKLGRVIYCIGLTADFRTRLIETVEAHVGRLLALLRNCDFDSVTYLSSTRCYGQREGTAAEDDALSVRPDEVSDLYNISKLMGESLLLSTLGRRATVVRLSNVYGDDFASENFLSDVIKDAVTRRHVVIRSSPDSAKDYVSVNDVSDAVCRIATSEPQHRIYNLAAGENVSHLEIIERLSQLTGCTFEFEQSAPATKFPVIDISRAVGEFNFAPRRLSEELPFLTELYTREIGIRE